MGQTSMEQPLSKEGVCEEKQFGLERQTEPKRVKRGICTEGRVAAEMRDWLLKED